MSQYQHEVPSSCDTTVYLSHINNRYFFVTYRAAQGELEIEHCPTEKMWADILTNTLQGKSFRYFQSEIMNSPFGYEDDESTYEYLDWNSVVYKSHPFTQ